LLISRSCNPFCRNAAVAGAYSRITSYREDIDLEMHRSFTCSLISLLLAAASGWMIPPLPSAAVSDIPPASLKIPPMVAEESVSTFVPSEAAPGKGLAVNVIYPAKPRYQEGAPVVVVVPGEGGADGLEFSLHAAQAGFAEVRFAFPGGGRPGLASGGVFDNRGVQSQQALKDVLLFAGGKIADTQGRTIQELVPAKAAPGNVGLAGWANGGNIALVTLGKYADELKFVGWAAFYESPLGQLFWPANLGSINDLVLNRHYRQGSCATGNCLVDYRKLRWKAEGSKSPGAHKRVGEPEIEGILFFDENGNKNWEESFEFALSYATDVGLDKQIYPPQVTRALERLKVFGDKWPNAVARLSESEAYFQERDGALYIPDVCQKLPSLLVTVLGTRLDHYQRQPDHPHIALQYNAWLANRAQWVRLNPDPLYAGQVSGMNPRNFVDNKPNAPIDASAMDIHLEPDGLVPDYVFMEACIAELADRKRANNLKPTLEAPLVSYTNGAAQPEK
jgi:hypothetical protein